jgi:glycosyltransferase involved in cell wall biosynthesis
VQLDASEAASPFVTVVVPVLDGERTIEGCLGALLSLAYPADRREILVVDNGSRDRTRALVARHPVDLLREPRRGPARARNRGIEAAQGEIVAFVDSDCLPTTEWLAELVKPFAHADVGGVAGEIVPFPPRRPAERYAARIRHLAQERYLARPTFPFAVTANLAFRRDVFSRIGLLDPWSPRGGEATDFCTRFFRGTEQRLELAPRALVFHRHRSTAGELFRQSWGYGEGHAYLYRKYRDDLPWGWAQRRSAYGDLARTAGSLAREGARYLLGREDRSELEFSYFELVRKTGLRLGFVWESVTQAHVSR